MGGFLSFLNLIFPKRFALGMGRTKWSAGHLRLQFLMTAREFHTVGESVALAVGSPDNAANAKFGILAPQPSTFGKRPKYNARPVSLSQWLGS
jgi:hypothetical protein